MGAWFYVKLSTHFILKTINMENKTIKITLTIIFIVYLLLSPILYQWYINNGYNAFATTLALIIVGFIGLYGLIVVWTELK